MGTDTALATTRTYGGMPVEMIEYRLNSTKYPRLNTIPKDKAQLILGAVITQAFLYRGQKPADDDVKFITANLYDELMKDEYRLGTGFLCMEEIRLAIKRSVLGLGEEMYGINVASLYSAVAKYARGEGRQAQKKANALREQMERRKMKEASIGIMIEARAGQVAEVLTNKNL